MRYKQMEYTVEFDEAILLCWIPTMLLQPIVENAIYHGMREMPEGGACVIRGMLERNGGIETLCFSVRDNGKGMDEEQLKQIWFPSPDRSGPDLSSFGIQNVQERIRLRFGDNYGIKIFSELGKGVEVQVRLPVVLEWEEQEKGSMDQDG
jgi:two-component system sensor histidine kinase YesM